jgi:serine O-acetyltransferase
VEDNVTLFHGVTLGGTGKHKSRRHPTVKAGSVIGARATILGPIIIGKNVKIGANAVVLKNIPSHSTVIGVPPAQRIIDNGL